LRVTQLGSQGGFLRARNATLLLGLEDAQVEPALAILEENCQTRTEQVPVELLGGMDAAWLPTEVRHGGATIFILPMDEIRRI
ncbi:MAG: cyclic-di-AMP receptor, partial [Chloroflexi bacterium]|nr:cyclic-di-AMP receptor [Chloroflexota bacterium]